MATINTNMSANIAANSMTRNERSMSSTMERLSTGLRINSAKDDAAGLAISSKMTSQVNGLNQAVRNANDAISMIQVGEGALKEVTNMFQRMRELAIQASSDSNTTADRTALNNEFTQLRDEVSRISSNTEWNGSPIFASGTTASTDRVFQIGANAGQTIAVNFQNFDAGVTAVQSTFTQALDDAASAAIDGDITLSDGVTTLTFDATASTTASEVAAGLQGATGYANLAFTVSNDATTGLVITAKAAGAATAPTLTLATGTVAVTAGVVGENGTDATSGSAFAALTKNAAGATANINNVAITSQSGSNEAMYAMDAAITAVNSQRASLGASMSRLEYAADNLQNVAQNTSAARSRVLDADYASETTELARTQIIQQASTAMLAQANQSQQAVLSLLK